MSTRILRQRDPNTSYRLVPLEDDGEATGSGLPLSTISKDQGKSKKWRITKNHSPTPADPLLHEPDRAELQLSWCQGTPPVGHKAPNYLVYISSLSPALQSLYLKSIHTVLPIHFSTPTNPVPHTSDLSGPSHLPPYHPKVSPTYCLKHPTIQDPLSAYSRTLGDFKPIFDTITVGGYGSPQQCICCC